MAKTLTEKHLKKLAENIVATSQMTGLAVELGLNSTQAEHCIKNNNDDRKAAVFNFFKTWLLTKENKQEAYATLAGALRAEGLAMLIGECLQDSPPGGAGGTTAGGAGGSTGGASAGGQTAQGGDTLAPKHLIALKKKLPKQSDIEDLAAQLDISDEMDISLVDKSTDREAAVHDLLKKWYGDQTDKKAAYRDLWAALKAIKKSGIAKDCLGNPPV